MSGVHSEQSRYAGPLPLCMTSENAVFQISAVTSPYSASGLVTKGPRGRPSGYLYTPIQVALPARWKYLIPAWV